MEGRTSPGPGEVLAALDQLDQRYQEALTCADAESVLRSSVARLTDDGVVDLAWVARPSATDSLVIDATAGARTDLLSELAVPGGSGLTGKVFRRLAPEWVDEYFSSSAITHHFDRHISAEGIHRLIAVPIVADGKPLGVLSAGVRSAGKFGDRAITRMVATANSAALAVTAAERARHAAEIAVHEERRRVAAELHDTVGALLYAIGSGLRGMREPKGERDPRLAFLEDQTSEAARLLREALRALHASPSEIALLDAIRRECRCLEERTGIKTHVIALSTLPTLERSRLGPVTRAVREALRNVEKHSRARSAAVTLSADRGELTIAITDDGAGFDPDSVGTGIGLASTADLLATVGGELRIESNPDGGTLWRAKIPV